MSSSPAYRIKAKLGGTPTGFIEENASVIGLTEPNAYRIDDTLKRVLATGVPLLVETSEGTPVTIPSANIESVDYLNGIITLTAAGVAALPVGFEDNILITASYIPLTDIGGGMECGVDIGGDVIDDTNFDNEGYRTRCYGLHDVSATIGRYDPLDLVFRDHKRNRESVLLEFRFGGGIEIVKGWFLVETESLSGDTGGLEKEDLQFNLDGEAKTALSVRIEL